MSANATLSGNLTLKRCPYCSVDTPNLRFVGQRLVTADHAGKNSRVWKLYKCSRCGGVIIASANNDDAPVKDVHPQPHDSLDESIPEIARKFLEQARDSIHAPAGAVMLVASAVEAMLKEKGYTEGVLYEKIEKAAKAHLITDGMKEWAHEVRLDANKPRHADEKNPLPNSSDAEKSIDFGVALATFLYVLPSRVQRGIVAARGQSQ